MHVKTGDTVIVVAGSEKGKIGEITKVNRKTGQVFLEGTNMKTRYQKPQGEGEAGVMEQKESPIHHSNVMHYSKEKQVRSRVGIKFAEDGKKIRYLKKTGEVLD
ncbi:unnamed protein product [Ostreobium quekettii]|nr:unnamed protein product [Ostreobium quekettii]